MWLNTLTKNRNQYATVFLSIVSRAIKLEVLSTGVAGNYNGALQVECVLKKIEQPIGSLMSYDDCF